MFQHSSDRPIEKELLLLAEEIENDSPGVKVLAARQFCYSVSEQPLQLHITEPRKINVLEEFILRAASELEPPPRPDELAAAMGLAPVFVNSTLDFLRSNKAIESTDDAPIRLTETGIRLHQQGIMPQSVVKKEVYLVNDQINKDLAVSEAKQSDVKLGFPNLDDYLKIDTQKKAKPSLKLIQTLARSLFDRCDDLADGSQIVAFELSGKETNRLASASIFLIYDFLDDKEKVQIRKGNKIVETATSSLQSKFIKEELPIDEIFGIKRSQINIDDYTQNEEQEICENEEFLKLNEQVENLKREVVRLQRENKSCDDINLTDKVEIIRDDKIRDIFINTLKEAKKQVVIFSPWITDEVVDYKFLDMLQNLVNKGVWIIIGHGIAKVKERETRPLSVHLENNLKNIKSTNSVNGVQVVWLGNMHNKEVIVDQNVFLHGSFNYLSYRGDRYPRGESVTKIKSNDTVVDAYKYYETKFLSHADNIWKTFLTNRNELLAKEAISLWCALDKQNLALSMIKNSNELNLLQFLLATSSHSEIKKDNIAFALFLEEAVDLINSNNISDSSTGLKAAWSSLVYRLLSMDDEIFNELLREKILPMLKSQPFSLKDDFFDEFVSKIKNNSPTNERHVDFENISIGGQYPSLKLTAMICDSDGLQKYKNIGSYKFEKSLQEIEILKNDKKFISFLKEKIADKNIDSDELHGIFASYGKKNEVKITLYDKYFVDKLFCKSTKY